MKNDEVAGLITMFIAIAALLIAVKAHADQREVNIALVNAARCFHEHGVALGRELEQLRAPDSLTESYVDFWRAYEHDCTEQLEVLLQTVEEGS